MRLLVLRARDQTKASAEQLAYLGHEVVIAPLSQIHKCVWSPPITMPAIWLATSANTFHYAGHGLEEFAAQVPPLALFVVGEKTAMAKPMNVPLPDFIAKNVDELCHFLENFTDLCSPWLYWTGQYRKPELEQLFKRLKQPAYVIETYRAEAVSHLPEPIQRALIQGEIEGVLHYSPRQAGLFSALCLKQGLQDQAACLHHFCLSANVASALAPLYPRHCHIAKMPTQKALLELLPQADFGS